jgi:ketosteroid isomerase-like protein
MTVKFYGKTVVMAGRFMMKGRYKGRDISGEYNYTNVLEKQQEQGWQIVASHAAPVA